MSSTTPAELSAATIIARINANEYPSQVLETIANGFLPLPQADLIAVLAFLTRSADAGIAAAARRSLLDIPTRNVAAFAADEAADPTHLALLARATEDQPVLEALIRNRALAFCARRRSSTPSSRIRRSPSTSAAARSKRARSSSTRRRAGPRRRNRRRPRRN